MYKQHKIKFFLVGVGIFFAFLCLIYFVFKLRNFEKKTLSGPYGSIATISVNAVTGNNVLTEIATSTFSSTLLGMAFDYHARGILRENIINGNYNQEDVPSVDRWSGTLEGTTPLFIKAENKETLKLYRSDEEKIISYTGQELAGLCDSRSFLNNEIFKYIMKRCELQKSDYGTAYIYFDIDAYRKVPAFATPEQMERAKTVPLYNIRGLLLPNGSKWPGMTIYISDSPYQSVTNTLRVEYQNLSEILEAIGKSLRYLPQQTKLTFEPYRDDKSGLSFLISRGAKIDAEKRGFTFVDQQEKVLMFMRFSLPHENIYENPNAHTLADYEKDYSVEMPTYDKQNDLKGIVHVSQSAVVTTSHGIRAIKQKYVVRVVHTITAEHYMDKSGGLDYQGFRYVFYVPQKGFYFLEIGDNHLNTSLTEIEKTVVSSLGFN